MVLPGTWRSLPSFKHDVALTMPDVARVTAIPRTDLSGSHRIPEPLLHEVVTVGELPGAHRSAGSATARRSGKADGILVVRAADVPAGVGHRCQIHAFRRRLNPTGSWTAALECRSSHRFSRIIWASHRGCVQTREPTEVVVRAGSQYRYGALGLATGGDGCSREVM